VSRVSRMKLIGPYALPHYALEGAGQSEFNLLITNLQGIELRGGGPDPQLLPPWIKPMT
jgi:hypothetical protein